MSFSSTTLSTQTLRPFNGRAIAFMPSEQETHHISKAVRIMRTRISRRRLRQATRSLMSRVIA